MIHAKWNELKEAFFIHAGIKINKDSNSYKLLLFYAVESGLKSIYLLTNKLYSTEKISDKSLRRTHDLLELVKELKLPANIAGTCPDFRLKRDNNSCWRIADAHQAWRYNIDIEETDQQNLVDWLSTIKAWIKENI
jgi:hypothetical protein